MLQELFLKKCPHLFKKDDKILLALSGGSDSVALFHLFKNSGIQIAAAHCNFGLRGDESDLDEKFVKELAGKFDIPFYSKCFETATYAKENKISIQVAARELRYAWLEEVRSENNFTFIATAHHLNDSMETVLLNLVKGTGIKGIRGIKEKNGKLIRPLIGIPKDLILEYLKNEKLDYREDSSNLGTKYQRNLLRHKVIPVLKEINPSLEKNWLSNNRIFTEVETLYEEIISQKKKKLLFRENSHCLIPILLLKKESAAHTILYEILIEFGFNRIQVDEIMAALDLQSGKTFYSAEHRLVKDRKFLIITALENSNSQYFYIDKIPSKVKYADQTLVFRFPTRKKFIIPDDKRKVSIDASKVEMPLVLRPWKKGDYFYPFGMKKGNPGKTNLREKKKKILKPGKKKLSNFLSDLKMSLPEKENVWVLLSGKKIVWVVGHRLDDRFKVSEKTEKVLRIELKKA